MRRCAPLLLPVVLLGACEWDALGPSVNPVDVCFSGCFRPTPTVSSSGEVFVGSAPADEAEATVLVYLPTDTERAIDSTYAWGGRYSLDFGPSPTPAVCGYVARARLWTGETTSAEPLFSGSGCVPSTTTSRGPSFHLPAYPPLAEPFVIRGRVLVDGASARADEVQLTIPVRGGQVDAGSISMSEGEWRLETLDAARRYSLCRRVQLYARHVASGVEQHPSLDRTVEPCGSSRQLPDVRIGSRLASRVWVSREVGPGITRLVGAGAARVSLASPVDSSIVGETFETLDDGSAHVWLPDDPTISTCDLLLRAELDGRVRLQPLRPPYDQSCYGGYHHAFEFWGT